MFIAPSHRGIPFVVCAVLLGSLQDALFKFLSADIVLWQVFVLRGVLATVLLLFFVPLMGGNSVTWRSAMKPWILLRSALFALVFVSFYAAVAVVDLAIVAACYYTAPIFITLLSALLLKEKIRFWGWCAVILGFVGVLVILRPSSANFNPFSLIPIFSAACYAFAAIIVRSKCQNEEPASLVISLNLILMLTGTVATLLLLSMQLTESATSFHPFLLGKWLWLDFRALSIIGFLAVLVISSTFLLVKAYQLTAPNIVATFDYSYLVFSVIWGVIIFSEVPDIFTLLGMVLITGAGMLSAKVKNFESKSVIYVD